MANALETDKFLAIEMYQFARMLPLVAPHWSGRIESAEAVQAAAPKAANAVRLQLHALAYNLGNFLRTLATPEPIKIPCGGG